MHFGWEPMGTGPGRGIRNEDWVFSDNYWSNDGQLFYARDAKNLAAALDRFLEAAAQPTVKLSKDQRRVLQAGAGVMRLLRQLERDGGPVPGRRKKRSTKQPATPWLLQNEGRAEVRAFAVFCREGSFRLY